MNDVQKVIKYAAIILAGFIILAIVSVLFDIVGSFIPDDKDNLKNFYEEYQNVREINVDSKFSKIIIQKGDKFSVDGSNVTASFTSSLNNGVLKIEETSKKLWNNNYDGVVTIIIDDTVLEKIDIEHGAGKLTIDGVSAKRFELEQGWGKVEISNVTFLNSSIDGGAGEIVINSANLKNLDLDIGAGKATIEAYLEGKNDINCGVGALDINLLGNKENYQINVNKGIGSVTIDGIKQSDGSVFGNGYNTINLDGGVGSIIVNFK